MMIVKESSGLKVCLVCLPFPVFPLSSLALSWTFCHSFLKSLCGRNSSFLSTRYQRCQFELPLYPDSGSCGQLQYMTPVTISPFSRWDEISERVKPSERPVVLNRASSTNTTNPFGSTFCYGYQVLTDVRRKTSLVSVCLMKSLYYQNQR